MFQSSFELTGYITLYSCGVNYYQKVSKLFRAYRLYNKYNFKDRGLVGVFQSSFELTGYITNPDAKIKLIPDSFQSSFELTGYITESGEEYDYMQRGFKALSSLQVI